MRRAIFALLPLFASFLSVGCATERPFVWASDLPAATPEGEGLIHERDTIVVSVRDQASLSGEFVVGEEGSIFMPTVGQVVVGGRPVSAVVEELSVRLATLVVRPIVTVSISRHAPIRVNVVGEVKLPAAYELTRDRSVTAALAAAGWLTEFANRDKIFVVRPGGDRTVRFRAREITTSNPTVSRFRLSDGDIVVVE